MIVAPRVPVDNRGMSFRNAAKVLRALRALLSLAGSRTARYPAPGSFAHGRSAQAVAPHHAARTALWFVSLTAGVGVLGLTGCGLNVGDAAAPVAEAIPGRTITGHVHGGVYPIRNATITLMETQTGPVASPGFTGTSTYGSAAKALLTTTSDQNGYFTFPDTFKCMTNEFAYIVVTGGHTNNLALNSQNNHVVQVGVIGACSTMASVAQIDKVNVFVSELSTVAAASALGNFLQITDPNDEAADQVVNIGAPLHNSVAANCSGGTLSSSCAGGLAHAFANAATLVDSVRFDNSFPTGQANTANAATSISSIPAPLINTMGNILQQCVDSIDIGTTSGTTTTYTPSSTCTNLFTAAKPPVGATPVDTMQVAMEMAKFPSQNISGLYGQIKQFAPFTPTLALAPTSFAISIFYGVQYNADTNTGSSIVQFPIDVALDYTDNAYVLYTTAALGSPTGVAEWAANGAYTAGITNSTYTYPNQIALDSASNVYVTNNNPSNTTNDAFLVLAGGTLFPIANIKGAAGIAGDANGNVFVSSLSGGVQASIAKFTYNTILYTYYAEAFGYYQSATPQASSSAMGPAVGLAIDSSQNVWAAGKSGTLSSSYVWASAGATAGGGVSKAFTSAGPFSTAVNASSTAYFPTQGVVNGATFSGGTITPKPNLAAVGNTTTPNNAPDRSEVDGAGVLFWTDRENTGTVFAYNPANNLVMSVLPCFAITYSGSSFCITTSQSTNGASPTPANLRGLAIDSAGNLWYTADAGYGAVIETLGVAAPTWPLLAYGHPGVRPQ